MCRIPAIYRRSLRPLVSLALLLFCGNSFSQNISSENSIVRIKTADLNRILGNISVLRSDVNSLQADTIIPFREKRIDKNQTFYDSLKVKASKNSFTKKIYSLVIVNPDTTVKKHLTGSSDASYISFAGKKIRNIEIQRMNVFGSNLNNPSAFHPNKLENVLNKTHVNTNEKIIRKNLLFSEGDTISPLTLSDNERLLRQLSFINDARIVIVPVSDIECDIIVLTKDVYSLGASYTYNGLKKGEISVFDKNIVGTGHELGIDIPYDTKYADSPGFGMHYTIDNLWKSFFNLNGFYLNGVGKETYGITISRKLISSSAKYAGGISIRQMSTTIDLNKTLTIPQPLKYNYQDYWLSRSFLINKESVSRIIIGGRYLFNNVFERPVIMADSYYYLQNYKLYLASAAFTVQKYYKTNLIYGYGRTEDIPYGGLLRLTVGREKNEFHNYRKRIYIGTEIAMGKSSSILGYIYTSAGYGTFLDGAYTEQGILSFSMKYFSNLANIGSMRIRNFVYADYTRGFGRNTDEYLTYSGENGFSGFKNDSVNGTQRLSLSFESVLFSPVNLYGFRFAFFGFSDFAFLSGSNEIIGNGQALTGIGLGVRIRNDNLVFNTFQFRIGFFPNPPLYSKINHLTISGEQLLRPNNFDSGPPAIIPYR